MLAKAMPRLFLDCIEETKKVVVKRKEALRISK
jgi:hypothetical protein